MLNLPCFTSCPNCGHKLPGLNADCPSEFCSWSLKSEATELEQHASYDDHGGLNFDDCGVPAMPLSAAQWERIADFMAYAPENYQVFQALVESCKGSYVNR